MRPIAPRTGAPEVTISEDQPEYMPVTIAVYAYENGSKMALMRWTFTAEERQRIAAGEDVYVGQLNFGNPITPLVVRCGPGDFAVTEANA